MSKKYNVKIDNNCKQNINYNGKPTREHFIDLLIKKNSWTVGVEVGTRVGRTLFHLLDNNPTLKMYSVDKDISQFYNTKIKEKYKDRLIVLEGSSWEQSININEKIDFVLLMLAIHTKT